MSTEKEYATYSVHRNSKVAQFWANKRGAEIILGNNSHIFLFEQGGAAQFGGVAFHTLPNKDDGTIEIYEIENIKKQFRSGSGENAVSNRIRIHNTVGGGVLANSSFGKG